MSPVKLDAVTVNVSTLDSELPSTRPPKFKVSTEVVIVGDELPVKLMSSM